MQVTFLFQHYRDNALITRNLRITEANCKYMSWKPRESKNSFHILDHVSHLGFSLKVNYNFKQIQK